MISGADPAAGSPVGISADVPVADSYVLSESGPDGYDASGMELLSGHPRRRHAHARQPATWRTARSPTTTSRAADPATITVVKFAQRTSVGRHLDAADFQL